MNEDLVTKLFLDLLDGWESGIHAARQRIEQEKLVDSRIVWEEKDGLKGKYQQATKHVNSENISFQELQKALKEHKGFWKSCGFSHWFHKDDPDVIDRRKMQAEK